MIRSLTSTRRPSPVPALTSQAELAILARALYREGYDDHRTGHITLRHPDGETFWTLPDQFGWNEVCSSQIIRIDASGTVVEGDWDVTSAIPLHLAYHERRHDVDVVLHQHPRYATIWSALGRVPPAYDQVSAFLADDEIAFYDDYTGSVADWEVARRNVLAMGDAHVALLANHGVMVAGADIEQAFSRAVYLEWRCQQAWRVEAVGPGRPMPEGGRRAMAAVQQKWENRTPMLWQWAVRREVKLDDSVLD